MAYGNHISNLDHRGDPDVTKLPCRIGTGDCEELRNKKATADGYCEECGKATCRSCAVELPSGLFHCLDCEDDLRKVAQKEQREGIAA